MKISLQDAGCTTRTSVEKIEVNQSPIFGQAESVSVETCEGLLEPAEAYLGFSHDSFGLRVAFSNRSANCANGRKDNLGLFRSGRSPP